MLFFIITFTANAEAEAAFFDIYIPPEEEPATPAAKTMKKLGMKTVDQQTEKIITGSILGGVMLTFTAAVVIALDLTMIGRDLAQMRAGIKALREAMKALQAHICGFMQRTA